MFIVEVAVDLLFCRFSHVHLTRSGGSIDMGGEKHRIGSRSRYPPCRQPLRPLRYPHPHQRLYQRQTSVCGVGCPVPNPPVSAIGV